MPSFAAVKRGKTSVGEIKTIACRLVDQNGAALGVISYPIATDPAKPRCEMTALVGFSHLILPFAREAAIVP
ncbi:hypothetical protein [Asticcacaulis sp.]|uniref:hypothetical protein n=1 Tax=Asticcacaulis sp. TaxID=1872648 RepID=UPI0026178FE9|nr:hypothetical protein [Asticcacaulis sp.]